MVNRRSDVGRIGEFRQDFIALWMLGCFRSLALGFSLRGGASGQGRACCFLHSFFVGLDFCLYLFLGCYFFGSLNQLSMLSSPTVPTPPFIRM